MSAGTPATPGDDETAFLKSVAQVDWLVLAVAGLYLAVASVPLPHGRLTLLVMVAFAAFAAWLRSPLFPLRATAGSVLAGVVVTVAFITFIAAQTGATGSPLVNLFLLPIVLAASALAARGTALTVALVAMAWLSLLAFEQRLQAPDLGLAARILGELGPFALVAWLTRALSGSVVSARRRVAELSERDSLTGLSNLDRFMSLLQREHQARGGTSQGAYALLAIDVDRLRKINDAWGHDGGNLALRNVAESLRRALRASDIATRRGGGEFLVLLPDASAQTADAIAQRIRNTVFQSQFEVGGRIQRLTVSVGAGFYPRDGREAGDVLAAAERRMQQDKELRRQRAAGGGPPRPLSGAV